MVVDVEMELKLEFSARPDLLRTTNSNFNSASSKKLEFAAAAAPRLNARG